MATNSIAAARRVRDAIRWAENQLAAAALHFGHGTANARDEAAWLTAGALGIDPSALAAHLGDPLPAAGRARLEQLVAARITTRKPAAYLLNEAWFAGLSFYVDERVIVPRSLTGEFIQEQFAPWIDATQVSRVLDLCTGSGCMAIACALRFPTAHVDAVDISEDALAVARINIERHSVLDRVRALRSDLFNALSDERYDVIVTNPPYVAHFELEQLPTEYGFEPSLALAAGPDGLDVILRILADASVHLKPGGILLAELGNSDTALQDALPEVPFVWLAGEAGDESVFVLTAEELQQHQAAFAAAVKRREA